MKRLGVIAVYDQDGIIDKSAEYLFSSLHEILNRMIIVVNGEVTEESYRVLARYSDDIVCRVNEGYDGGAYQDIFLHRLTREQVLEYDEIVLLNNTFYGPFYPWSQVFWRMDRLQADFWGLSKHLTYYSSSRNQLVLEYINTYFLAFRKKLFSDNAFWLFWETMKPIRNFDEVTLNFEFALTPYLSNAGFRHAVYTDLYPECRFLQNENEVIYSSFCCDLLRECQFPVLKKRDGVSIFNPQTLPAKKQILKKKAISHLNVCFRTSYD